MLGSGLLQAAVVAFPCVKETRAQVGRPSDAGQPDAPTDAPDSTQCSLEVDWERGTRSLPCSFEVRSRLVRLRGFTDVGVRLLGDSDAGDLTANVDVILVASRVRPGIQRGFLDGGALAFWRAEAARGPMECSTLSDAHGNLTLTVTSVRRIGDAGFDIHGAIEAQLVCVVGTSRPPRLRLRF